jgi:yersiniabactin nonribosomal peptide synthetase
VIEGLRRLVAEAISRDPAAVPDDEDLIGQGMDSISIMKIATRLRSTGLPIGFADLVERPTLAAWAALLSTRSAVPASPPEPDGGPEYASDDRHAPFELAPMQHAYWVGRMEGQPLASGCHFYCEFDGRDVSVGRLERAVRLLLQRHEMLRARFLPDGRQQVLAQSPWPALKLHDLRHVPPDLAARELEAIRRSESTRCLRVEDGEVFDVQVSLLPRGLSRLHVNVEMLVSDATSFRITLDDLAALYLDPDTPLPPISYSFARYLADTRPQREAARDRAAVHWHGRLGDLPAPPALPVAPDANGSPTGVERLDAWLPPAERARLVERARRHGLTPSMVLAAIYAQVIAAWSTAPRFTLVLPLFDREPVHPDVARLVGDFTGLLLLPVDTSGPHSFVERARRMQETFQRDVAHVAYSGVDVLRDLARARAAAPAPAVVFTSALGLGDMLAGFRKLFGPMRWMSSQTAQVCLDHQVTEHEDGLLLSWDAVSPHFPDGVVEAMFETYVAGLRWLLEPDSDWQADLPLPPPGTRAGGTVRLAPARVGIAPTAAPADSSERPEGPVEQAFADLWCELLDLSRVGRHDNFFALGGDSLLATRFVQAVPRRLGIELSLRQLFSAPSIAELAAAVPEFDGGGVEVGVI